MSQTQDSFRWERIVVLELQREHARVCKERRIFLRPLLIKIGDLPTSWAQFDNWTRTLTFSRNLIFRHAWFEVLGVLRHQMAHQYVHETLSERLKGTSGANERFELACRRLGVLPQFSKWEARLGLPNLDWHDEKPNAETQRVLDKIRKLLSLAQSSNEHEAALAMSRVRQIYARHNLEKGAFRSKDEFVHSVISTGQKKMEAWEFKILSILIAFFFVKVLTLEQLEVATGEKKQAFELIGTRENVLMAEYVYHFLVHQVHQLADAKRSPRGQKLTRCEKNSFRLGVIEGFAKRLAAGLRSPARDAPDSDSAVVAKALCLFQKDPMLSEHLHEIYPHLKQRVAPTPTVDARAFQDGRLAGSDIVLHQPLSQSSSEFGGLLKSPDAPL